MCRAVKEIGRQSRTIVLTNALTRRKEIEELSDKAVIKNGCWELVFFLVRHLSADLVTVAHVMQTYFDVCVCFWWYWQLSGSLTQNEEQSFSMPVYSVNSLHTGYSMSAFVILSVPKAYSYRTKCDLSLVQSQVFSELLKWWQLRRENLLTGQLLVELPKNEIQLNQKYFVSQGN